MKLIHLSDLHIGKRVHEISMLEDQAYILTKITSIIDEEKPDGVIIAGDVYDKSVPSAEAVLLFDSFLVGLSSRDVTVFIISGNHDSPERIAFGSRLMSKSGVHFSPVYDGSVTPVTIDDAFGPVDIYMLPFIKPAHVKRYFEDAEIETYSDAVKTALENIPLKPAERSILITHQFVAGALRSESEELSVGGSDQVDAAIFEPFDYVALGHIHRPQHIGRETVRYCGTPLKYSFSEASHAKSVCVIELFEKGRVVISQIPLIPKRDMRELKGSYMELTARSFYQEMNTDDYLHITLTDEEDIPDAIGKLRVIYPNIMKLDYDNTRTRTTMSLTGSDPIETKTPMDHFAAFYELQNNQPLNDAQYAFTSKLIETIWEGVQ